MILKQSIADIITVLAYEFGIEEVEETLTLDKFRATEDGDVEAGVIGTVYPFKLEVVASSLEAAESLCFGCDSLAVKLAQYFATTYNRTDNINDRGEKEGYLITYNCKTII